MTYTALKDTINDEQDYVDQNPLDRPAGGPARPGARHLRRGGPDLTTRRRRSRATGRCPARRRPDPRRGHSPNVEEPNLGRPDEALPSRSRPRGVPTRQGPRQKQAPSASRSRREAAAERKAAGRRRLRSRRRNSAAKVGAKQRKGPANRALRMNKVSLVPLMSTLRLGRAKSRGGECAFPQSAAIERFGS